VHEGRHLAPVLQLLSHVPANRTKDGNFFSKFRLSRRFLPNLFS
jgi:hypothetical protein